MRPGRPGRRGQNTVEYLLMVSVVVVLISGAALKTFMPSLFSSISGMIAGTATSEDSGGSSGSTGSGGGLMGSPGTSAAPGSPAGRSGPPVGAGGNGSPIIVADGGTAPPEPGHGSAEGKGLQ